MSTLYKSELFDLTSTNVTTIYTCPTETETIVKTIQSHNHGTGNVVVQLFITRGSTTYEIAHHSLAANASQNILDGTIILESADILKLQAGAANDIQGVMSYMEVRSDTNNPL
jgi:hypothetical protein|tara:strand:+ start:284 stop:622 length:339 start_codon:yes stop_codon:yes gene_type:complete